VTLWDQHGPIVWKTNLPRISFVIPAYNEETKISSCIMAIHQEIERSNIIAEIVVVNNASTDGTNAVVSSIMDEIPIIRLVYEPRQGLVWARRDGALWAQYDLIANIDADCIMPVGWIDKALKIMDDPQVVLASGPFVYYDTSGLLRLASKFFYFIGYLAHNTIGPMMQGGNYIVRKDALKVVGGYDLDIQFFGEDTATAIRLATVGKVKFNMNFWIYSSARRLLKEGRVRTTVRYSINYLWITWFKKPFTPTHKDIRPV
jgi:glycosyltransferase involved in cell wall biosynthesis